MNKRIKVLVSAVLAAVMLVICIPFTAAAAGATATKVTSVSEITDGNYIIAATKNNKTYAITGVSGSKTTVVEITVTNGTVSEVPAAAVLTFTAVSGKTNTVTIKTIDGTSIGCKDGAGDMNTNVTEWKISDGFSFVGGTNTTRALALSVASSPTFKNYATSNAGTANYAFELEVYKVSGTVDAPTPVTCPLVVGTGYTISAVNGKGTIYVDGTVASGRFNGVYNAEDAAVFYIEAATNANEYLLYFMNGETKTYVVFGDASDDASTATAAADATVFEWNGDKNTLVVADDSNNRAFAVGATSTFDTFSSYDISGDYNWGVYTAVSSGNQGGTTISPDTNDGVVAYIAVAVVALFGIAYVSKKKH